MAHHPWGLELDLGDLGAATVDLRSISADPAVIGDDRRWPRVGEHLRGTIQGTMPNGQIRVTLLAVDDH
jgi:hypothetical protein